MKYLENVLIRIVVSLLIGGVMGWGIISLNGPIEGYSQTNIFFTCGGAVFIVVTLIVMWLGKSS